MLSVCESRLRSKSLHGESSRRYPDLLHEDGGTYEYLNDYDACSGSSSSSSSSSSSGPGSPPIYFRTKDILYPSDTDQDQKIITSYAYTFYPGTCQIRQRTTTLPVISSGQNGSGVAATRRDYFDEYGNVIWRMDERGFITYSGIDIVTGALVQSIQDVDTTEMSDVPAGWETPTGGGLHLVTDFSHDDRGRLTQALGPQHSIDVSSSATTIRRATWMVYKEGPGVDENWVGQGYATGEEFDTFTLINPVSIVKQDKNGLVLESIQAARASTSGKLEPTDSFPQTSYTRWTTNQYTDCCIQASTRVYHTIPTSGPGSSGTNYDETLFGYDVRKRRIRSVTPGGTITRQVLDARSLTLEVFVGTNDNGATPSDPTGGGAGGNNMVQVTGNEYDDGQDGGNGNLTEQTQHVNDSTTRVTSFVYDFRNRRVGTDGEEDFYQKSYFDNLDRMFKSERYDTNLGGNLIARSETLFDDRSRVYATKRYAVDPGTGSVGNALRDDTWYDASGHTIKQQPAGAKLFTKFEYDGVGRRTHQYTGYDLSEASS
jgi:hypothetical protein